jgi:hypothetical protein
VVHGDGRVTLRLLRHYRAEPELRTAPVPRAAVVALLALAEELKLPLMDDRIEGDGHTPTRILRLQTESLQKKVASAGGTTNEFERLVGALKVVAAQALPEAAGHRFLPNL